MSQKDGTKPAAFQLNNHIQTIMGALKRVETNLINEGEQVTAQKALDVYQGKGISGMSLIEDFANRLEKMERIIGLAEGVSPRKLCRYRTVRKHFTEYLQMNPGIKDITLPLNVFKQILTP